MNDLQKQTYAIITPAKNEEENVEALVKTIALQKMTPHLWVFVNDGSVDNTVEKFTVALEQYKVELADTTVTILNYKDFKTGYALGQKYSRVIKYGMNHVDQFLSELDFVGILDCDIQLPSDYYEKIIQKFQANPKLGIASAGSIIEYDEEESIKKKINKTHTPGGFRVWNAECLRQTGYTPTVSQDAVSEARAIMMGWKVSSFADIELSMRKMGAKFGYEYYGKSAYIRHVPFLYVLLGTLNLMRQNRMKDGKSYYRGYRSARKEKVSRIEDAVAIKFFRRRLYYRLLGK
ncbi:MAG: glycosyltransferase family 2 protein [Flavobacteriaceae bacterium]|nr:glycosyltransferase family 2 protein [Flavobacteriaceae bacterium]